MNHTYPNYYKTTDGAYVKVIEPRKRIVIIDEGNGKYHRKEEACDAVGQKREVFRAERAKEISQQEFDLADRRFQMSWGNARPVANIHVPQARA